MLLGADCSETVSILESLRLETGDACISLGLPSLLAGVCLFIAAVVVLRTVALAILRGEIAWMRFENKEIPMDREFDPEPETLKRQPYESPIKSTGAWGGKPR